MTLVDAPRGPLGNYLEARQDQTGSIPDIIEFCASDAYLSRGSLYPRQGTLLKVIFLQKELFTQYDYDVLGEWSQGFYLPDQERIQAMSEDDRLRYDGNNGIVPDVLERIDMLRTCPGTKEHGCGHDIADHFERYGRCLKCKGEHRCGKYRGYRWFREVDNVAGRRGSKGHLGALCGSYVLWHYLKKGDPQKHYGVDRDKQMACFVYAAKKDQAKVNQWADLKNVIVGGPCFGDYIAPGSPTAEMLKVKSPHDDMRQVELMERGIIAPPEPTFLIVPKESTVTSGRGPASFMQFYDEMAWVVRETASASAEEVYGAATPALDQFGVDAFIYAGSSPWQMMGQFYQNWEEALTVDHDTLKPTYPNRLTVQLASWDPYKDYERSHRIFRVGDDTSVLWRRTSIPGPEGEDVIVDEAISDFHFDHRDEPRRFPEFDHPIQSYDDEMRKLEKANPENFDVERRAHWATAQDAYLNPHKVDDVFGLNWDGKPLHMKTDGILSVTYCAHGDPSKSGDNFGFAIAHTEGPDDRGLIHVVFDLLRVWRPQDFEADEHGLSMIDYYLVGEDLKEYIRRFMPSIVSFDQFNSVSTIQNLRVYVAQTQLPKRVDVFERTATAPVNWKMAEVFKAATNMGLVHAPDHELAKAELKFLQEKNGKVDHPSSGPVQSKDVADCMINVTYSLIGDQMAVYINEGLSKLQPGMSVQGGTGPAAQAARPVQAGVDMSNAFSAARGRTGTGMGSRGRGMPTAPRPTRTMPGVRRGRPR